MGLRGNGAVSHVGTPRREPRSGAGSLAGAMSTRRLILAALACGLAILVAFAVQLTLVTSH